MPLDRGHANLAMGPMLAMGPSMGPMAACEHWRVRRLPARVLSPSDVGSMLGGVSDQPRARTEERAAAGFRIGLSTGHATPFGSKQAGGRGEQAAGGKSRQAR